ncbi:MAG TPA: diguanylate cyclase, partial [Caulobacteraceae bacterium]|nr:diguanylate cyclase [Caulobacteraceae bacterium]
MLAVLVSACGSITAFRLYSRLRGSRGMVRFAWTLLTGFVAGAGAWATHFLAMLAYNTGMPTGYWPAMTMASLMVAVIFTCAGFGVASIGRRSARQVAGGVLVGLGLAAMSYVGMFAMVTQGRLELDVATVGASVAVGVIGALLALVAADRSRKAVEQVAGGVLLTLAICAVHLIAMASLTIVPDASLQPPRELISGGVVTFGVASIAVFLIMGGLGAALIEASATSSALQRIRRLADAAYEGIVVVLDGRINDCNAAFIELTGAPISELKGRRLSDVMTFDDGSILPQDEARHEALLRPLGRSEAIPVEVFARLMDDGARQETSGMTVLTVRDLRERRAADEKIRYLAEHDALTGLPNRNALQARLASVVERVEASNESLALLCVDIDHFKEANDLHGHQAGDALLMEVARRLQASVSAPSFAGRLGADEFIVVQVAGGDQPGAAAELAGHILDLLREPVDVGGHSLHAAARIGISLFPHDGRTGEALLANADMAL